MKNNDRKHIKLIRLNFWSTQKLKPDKTGRIQTNPDEPISDVAKHLINLGRWSASDFKIRDLRVLPAGGGGGGTTCISPENVRFDWFSGCDRFSKGGFRR